MKVTTTYDDTLYQLVPKEPTEKMRNAAIRLEIETSNQWDDEPHHSEIYRAMLSAVPTPPAQPAERMPLTEERIHELLGIGNPSEEECRLIRLGWDAAHGITAPKEPS